MADYLVTDMEHMEAALSPDARVPAPAQRLALYLGDIVQAATALEPGGWFRSALPCRRRPGRKPCPGRLMALRAEVPPEIHWECPDCGEGGLITNWRGTYWDFASKRIVPPEYPDDPAAEARLTHEDYRMLRQHVITASVEEDQLVAAAQLSAGAIVMRGPRQYMEELLGSVAAAANHASSRYLQRRLDTLFERIARAVEGCQVGTPTANASRKERDARVDV